MNQDLEHNNTFPHSIESDEIQSLIAQSKARVSESFEKGSDKIRGSKIPLTSFKQIRWNYIEACCSLC